MNELPSLSRSDVNSHKNRILRVSYSLSLLVFLSRNVLVWVPKSISPISTAGCIPVGGNSKSPPSLLLTLLLNWVETVLMLDSPWGYSWGASGLLAVRSRTCVVPLADTRRSASADSCGRSPGGLRGSLRAGL